MLKHHADANGARLRRAADPNRLAQPVDAARVRLHHPVDDFDERALSRAILAQQCMDFVLPDRQIDRVIGKAAGKLLGNAAQRQ
jgi:hypothetical protein